ncbi:hypothetical protein HK096_011124, partial [Nowakowskiella sp. JEL0078]
MADQEPQPSRHVATEPARRAGVEKPQPKQRQARCGCTEQHSHSCNAWWVLLTGCLLTDFLCSCARLLPICSPATQALACATWTPCSSSSAPRCVAGFHRILLLPLWALRFATSTSLCWLCVFPLQPHFFSSPSDFRDLSDVAPALVNWHLLPYFSSLVKL